MFITVIINLIVIASKFSYLIIDNNVIFFLNLCFDDGNKKKTVYFRNSYCRVYIYKKNISSTDNKQLLLYYFTLYKFETFQSLDVRYTLRLIC